MSYMATHLSAEIIMVVMVQYQGHAPAAWRGKGIFLPASIFSAASLTVSLYTPMCNRMHFNICVHVNDPLVHVRVSWIMETLKHPAGIVG